MMTSYSLVNVGLLFSAFSLFHRVPDFMGSISVKKIVDIK